MSLPVSKAELASTVDRLADEALPIEWAISFKLLPLKERTAGIIFFSKLTGDTRMAAAMEAALNVFDKLPEETPAEQVARLRKMDRFTRRCRLHDIAADLLREDLTDEVRMALKSERSLLWVMDSNDR